MSHVEPVPSPPADRSIAALTTWVNDALKNSTAVLCVWTDKSQMSNILESEFDLLNTIIGTEFSKAAPEISADQVKALAVASVKPSCMDLKSVGQTHIHGVPRSVAKQFADQLQTKHASLFKCVEVDGSGGIC